MWQVLLLLLGLHGHGWRRLNGSWLQCAPLQVFHSYQIEHHLYLQERLRHCWCINQQLPSSLWVAGRKLLHLTQNLDQLVPGHASYNGGDGVDGVWLLYVHGSDHWLHSRLSNAVCGLHATALAVRLLLLWSTTFNCIATVSSLCRCVLLLPQRNLLLSLQPGAESVFALVVGCIHADGSTAEVRVVEVTDGGLRSRCIPVLAEAKAFGPASFLVIPHAQRHDWPHGAKELFQLLLRGIVRQVANEHTALGLGATVWTKVLLL